MAVFHSHNLDVRRSGMSDKTFRRLLILTAAIGGASLIALVVYTAVLYSDVSIISFIANGR